ncbi:hypothetical protein FQA39_LY03787 [Lamprigera yunnana]|nr:hypothetical protein FQA39_LY03787 [Lamprigera yunnana]
MSSQIAAAGIQNMMVLSNGMGYGYITILVADLSDKTRSDINLNEEELSWIGSIMLLSCLLGCTISGITEIFGKVRIIQVATIPFFLSWIILYFAYEMWHICISLTIIGICSGIVQAPILSYIAEISQPQLRGILTASSTLSFVFGILVEYFLGILLHWRILALFSSFFPLSTFILLWFIPESPYWLVARNRNDEALKSLSWLRGWVKDKNVEVEFQSIFESQQSNLSGIDNPAFDDSYLNTINQDTTDDLKKLKVGVLKLYTKKSFLYPFAITAFLFFLINFTGILALQTYGIRIITSLRVPINEYYAVCLMGISSFAGAVVCVLSVRYLGKRLAGFISMFGVGVCNISMGIYAFICNIKDLEINELEEHTRIMNSGNWLPLIFLILIAFSAYSGLTTLPWMLIGEVFSQRTRAIGCGLSSTIYFITGFLANKIFFDMIFLFYFYGLFWFYGILSIVGLVISYFVLPETEGKTLGEILDHFSGVKELDKRI